MAQSPATNRNAAWVAHKERGSSALLRAMAFISVRLGRRFSRPIVYAIAAYFFCFAPAARRASRAYLALALRRAPTARDRFRHILSFATTIHDRVYLIKGRYELFDISVEGMDLLEGLADSGGGALLLGAHLGSFEVMHSLARWGGRVKVAMAMYEENARKISGILAALNPGETADIVSLGHVDAMLKLADRLAHGVSVGVLADRTLGSEPTQAVTLLGRVAQLPLGPLRAAALLRCPVYFMAGLYRGANRYHVVCERIADFSETGSKGRASLVREAIDRYATILDKHCRHDPYNWFNFFDFWNASV
jgi:predicted LPLAT superfamily acyltransferase